jgi:hypothetical protein
MNIENAKKALSAIQIGDPRESSFAEIADEVKAALLRGATVKQICAALAPEFGGDTRFLARAVGALRKRRAGRPKKSATTPAATPAPASRKTLTLSPSRAA